MTTLKKEYVKRGRPKRSTPEIVKAVLEKEVAKEVEKELRDVMNDLEYRMGMAPGMLVYYSSKASTVDGFYIKLRDAIQSIMEERGIYPKNPYETVHPLQRA